MPRPRKLTPEQASANDAACRKRWHKANTEAISIRVRKGKRDAYNALAAARGTSVSALIQAFMDAECQKCGIEVKRGTK